MNLLQKLTLPILTVSTLVTANAADSRLLPEGNFNVLFIPVDDFRVLINSWGEDEPLRPVTPNMDKLTASAVSFANAHCQQAVCNASRASLLTGLRPDYTRCWKLDTFFRDTVGYDLKTLPQHFAENGYTTHGIGKIYHSTNSRSQDDEPGGSRSWNDGWFNARGAKTYYEAGKAEQEDAGINKVSATDAGSLDRQGNPITDEAYDDGVAAAAAVAKIAEYAAEYHTSGRPFFLAVGFKKPHLPFNCPKPYWDLYDPDAIDLQGYDGSHTMPVGTNRFTAPYGGEPDAFLDITGHPDTKAPDIDDARHLIHGYLACASFIDNQVGKLLDALENPDGNPSTEDSIKENTIVVLWSDHGFFLGEHNGFWAKHCNFEISTRVPLIVRAPGMELAGSEGQFCHAPVELVDLYPTLVDLCTLPQPIQPQGMELQGTSFRRLLEDPRQPWKKAAFSQYQRNISDTGTGDISVTNSGPGMGYSIRTSRYRYTEWWRTVSSGDNTDLHQLIYQDPEHIELYDYVNDPSESVNLANDPAYADLVNELASLLNDSETGYAGDGWKQTTVNAPAEYPSDLISWSSGHMVPGIRQDDLHPQADPDKDGWVNCFEYKFGTHPLEKDDPGITRHFEGPSFSITFPLVESRSDVSLALVQSDVLSPQSWSVEGFAEEVAGQSGHATLHKSSVATGEKNTFVSFRCTYPVAP